VVAGHDPLLRAALEGGQRAVEQERPGLLAAVPRHVGEEQPVARPPPLGEPARQVPLAVREHGDRPEVLALEQVVHPRALAHADQHQRWFEGDRDERRRGHCDVVLLLGVDGGHDGHAAGEVGQRCLEPRRRDRRRMMCIEGGLHAFGRHRVHRSRGAPPTVNDIRLLP
jgi:hypothetical protein